MDSRTFWKTDVPLFRNKPSKIENIINEDDKSISDEKKLSIINTFFSYVVSNLDRPNHSTLFQGKEVSLPFSYYRAF